MTTTRAPNESIDARSDTDTQRRLYRTMTTIRSFEVTAEKLFKAGRIPGFIHVSIGQEASAAGVVSALRTTDYITTTHRGHGHTLAKGAPLEGMMAELFGKATGICRGRGGSMHIADFTVGMLGANGIVAGGVGIAVGAALGSTLRGENAVAVPFFGDGATARGPFAESLNLAQVWQLPVVFACEANGWASTTRSSESLAGDAIGARATAIGMPAERVDGNDVLAVRDAAAAAVDRARSGGGPTFLQIDTFRLRGHFVGDPTTYYDPAELASWTGRDPLVIARTVLTALPPDEFDELDRAAVAAVAAAVEYAEAADEPDPAGVAEHLFASAANR